MAQDVTAGSRARSPWRLFRLQNAGVIYALIAIVAAVTIAAALRGQPSYLRPVSVSNVLDQTSFVGILAIFMTVVLITGNFDLSVGSVAAMSGALTLKVLDGAGLPLALVLALGAGLLVGILNGVLVQVVGVNAFIVTLGTLVGIRGVVLIITDGRAVSANSEALADFESGTLYVPRVVALALGGLGVCVAGYLCLRQQRREGGRLRVSSGAWPPLVLGTITLLIAALVPALLVETKPVWFMLIAVGVVGFVLKYTVLGRRLYAVGGNTEAARLSGINVARYKIGAFMLNGLAAAFVGVLYAGKFNAIDPTALSGTELTVLAAAILGGTSLFGGSGSVGKSAVGGLILFTLNNGFNILNLGANYQGVVQGIVIIGATAVYTISGRARVKRLVAETPTAGHDASLPPAPRAVTGQRTDQVNPPPDRLD